MIITYKLIDIPLAHTISAIERLYESCKSLEELQEISIYVDLSQFNLIRKHPKYAFNKEQLTFYGFNIEFCLGVKE